MKPEQSIPTASAYRLAQMTIREGWDRCRTMHWLKHMGYNDTDVRLVLGYRRKIKEVA